MSRADGGLRQVVRWRLLTKPHWLSTAVETGLTAQGVPDTYWAHPETRTSGWIEHKATGGWAVRVRPLQVSWLSRHAAAGVRCSIFVRATGRASADGRGDSLWVLRPEAAEALTRASLREIDPALVLGRWPGKPEAWDWERIGQILTG